MPFTVQPYRQPRTQRPSTRIEQPTAPSQQWIAKQAFNSTEMTSHLSTNISRSGTILGGRNIDQYANWGNEQVWKPIIAPRPTLNTPVLNGGSLGDQTQVRRQLGALEYDALDPLNMLTQIADQGRLAAPGSDPLGFLEAPIKFFESKNIDLFGMGSTGFIARSWDYSTNVIAGAIFGQDALNGKGMDPNASAPHYKFQEDNRYWTMLRTATPEQLDTMAMQLADKYMDPVNNAYYVSILRTQFENDRKTALSLTSGNEGADWRAIKTMTQGIAPFNRDVASIPLAGVPLLHLLDPVRPEEQAAWEALTPEARAKYLGQAGIEQMVGDVAGTMPLLFGGSAVLTAVKAGAAGGAAMQAGNAFSWALKAASAYTSFGVAVATATWATEAYAPMDSELGQLARKIDMSRPVSNSNLAGLVNGVGYWTTGSWGTAFLVKSGLKVAGRGLGTVGAAAGKSGLMGVRESLIFAANGGSKMANKVIEAIPGVTEQQIRFSQQTLDLSTSVKVALEGSQLRASAIMEGERTGIDSIDNLVGELRQAHVQTELVRDTEAAHHTAAQFYDIITASLKGEPLNPLATSARNDWLWAKRIARVIENLKGTLYTNGYGPAWAARTAGDYTEKAMQAYVDKVVTRLGGTVGVIRAEGIGAATRTNSLLQAMRMLHHLEFDRWNAKLYDAVEAVASEEGKALTAVSQRHLFNDSVKTSLEVLRGADKAAAKAEAQRIVQHTIEGEKWLANDFKGSLDSIDAGELADWIEDVQGSLMVRRRLPTPGSEHVTEPINALHVAMDAEGTWTLAFKPVDEAGNFVSYIKPRKGGMFQTPFLDYPVSARANIELGNRGIIGRKYDAVFRGFRTNRMAEFQKASLFRWMGDRYSDFTPTQVETFFHDVAALAVRHKVQPQTLGTVGQFPGVAVGGFEHDLNLAAKRIFGDGPYMRKDGFTEDINWRQVVAKSYRQSLHLNLTAGVTSHIKAFGPVGHAAAWFSDIGYVNIRFNLSPIFKGGEYVESAQFNAMLGVNPRGDPLVEALMRGAGGNQHGILMQEAPYDQVIQGIGKVETQDTRAARSYAFYSLRAPESQAQRQARAVVETQTAALHDAIGGGDLMFADRRAALQKYIDDSHDQFGNVLPGLEEQVAEAKVSMASAEADAATRLANRVGPELPPDYTLDPMDLGPSQYSEHPSHIFDDTMLPEDRGLYHGTTDLNGVMETGLKSRHELVVDEWQKSPGLWESIKTALDDIHPTDGRAGSGRNIWVTYVRDGKQVTEEVSDRSMGAFTTRRYDDTLRLDGVTTLHSSYYGGESSSLITGGDIIAISKDWRGRKLWRREGPTIGHQGLGNAVADSEPSLATRPELGQAVAERMRIAARAARGEASGADITGHFINGYDYLYDTEAVRRMVNMVDEVFTGGSGANRAGRRTYLKYTTMRSKLFRGELTEDEALAELDSVIDQLSPKQKYRVVQKLDAGMSHYGTSSTGVGPEDLNVDSIHVGMLGTWENMAKNDPNNMGVVQVGIMKNASWHTGPDNNEIRAASPYLFVLDTRIMDAPLATDAEGLTAQMRQTIHADGSVRPGMQYRHDSVAAEMTRLEREGLPPGELAPRPYRANPDAPGSEFMPTADLHPYREFDRRKEPKFAGGGNPNDDTAARIAEIKARLQASDDLQAAVPGSPEANAFRAFLGPDATKLDTAMGYQDLVDELDALTANAPLQLTTRPGGAYYNSVKDHIQGRIDAGLPGIDPADPLILDFDPATNTALLREGNLRLAIAEDLGITELPVRVVVQQHRAAPGFGSVGARPEIGDAAAWQGRQLPADYLYHGTKPGNFASIEANGLTPNKRGNIFWDKADHQAFATDSNNLLLRTPEQPVTQRGGGWVSDGPLPPDQLEFYGADGEWHPVVKAATPGPPQPLGPKWRALPDEPMLQPNIDGYIPADARPSQIFSTRVDQVSNEADIAGGGEYLIETVRENRPQMLEPTRWEKAKGKAGGWWNPIPFKEHQQTLLVNETMRRDFPTLLRMGKADGMIAVLKELKIPERDWLPFMLKDRDLATKFSETGHPDDLAALLKHAGGDAKQEEWNALYQSDEWAAVTGLWAINLKAAEQDAFAVHFFNPYRSAFERSLNHPLTGIYPLSWSLKAARQWIKFLYDNEMIAGINMHMTPAVALAQITRAQKVAFAQSNPEDLDPYLDHNNPLGSTFMIANLMLPGDWSSIPFPASRAIRDLIRGGWTARTLPDNMASYGLPRDMRLGLESLGEVKDMTWGPDQEDPNTPWRRPLTTKTADTWKTPKRGLFGLDITRQPITVADQGR